MLLARTQRAQGKRGEMRYRIADKVDVIAIRRSHHLKLPCPLPVAAHALQIPES